MLTTHVPGDMPTYTYPVEQDPPHPYGDTVIFSGEMIPLLTGSYARIAAVRQIADFSIGMEPRGEFSLVREVLISPLDQEIGNGVPPSVFGWTSEEARKIRASLSAWAEDWDDPAMDAYNVLFER